MATHGMAGEGAWGYSQGIAAGGLVHFSGQVPRDEREQPLVGPLEVTFARAFDLLESAGDQLGCQRADFVHVQLFMFAGDLDEGAELYRRRYGESGAAMSLVVVDGLNHPDYALEVSAVAAEPGMSRTTHTTGNPLDDRLGRSSAVRVGDLIYVSGQPSVGPDGEAIESDAFVDHYRQAFGNFAAAVVAAGGTPESVVSTHTFVTEAAPPDAAAEVRQIHHDAVGFGPNRPASTLVRVSALSAPGAKVEVMGVAVVDEQRTEPD